MYDKKQFIIILISIVVNAYALFFYFEDREMEKSGTLKFHEVLLQSCRNYKGGSSLRISYGSKIYAVGLSNGECPKYPIGSKIGLIYNVRFDYFYKPDGLKRDRNRLFFTGSIFVLSMLPWRKFNLRKRNKH